MMHRFALYVFTLDGSRSDANATLAQCYTSVVTVTCEHARFCVEVFFMRYIYIFIHSFIHYLPLSG